MLSMPIVLVNLLLLFAGAAARNLTYSFYEAGNDLFLQVSGSLPTSETVSLGQDEPSCGGDIFVVPQGFCLYPPGEGIASIYRVELVDTVTLGTGVPAFLGGGSISGDPTIVLFFDPTTFDLQLKSDYVSGSPIDALIVFEGESLDSAGLSEEPQVLFTAQLMDPRNNPSTGIGAFVILEILETPPAEPSLSPSKAPTTIPSEAPTTIPSEAPTTIPSEAPTTIPSEAPTTIPSEAPTTIPSEAPTTIPSEALTTIPSEAPTTIPSKAPTTIPSKAPTTSPSKAPMTSPSKAPMTSPSKAPTTIPSKAPTTSPSKAPTTIPSEVPTKYNGLKLCQVDCDSDSDCAPGLLCADDHKRALKNCGMDQRKVLCVQDGFEYRAIDRRNRLEVCFDPTDARLAECRFD